MIITPKGGECMADIKQIQVGNTNYNIAGAAIVLEENGTSVNNQWKAKTSQISSLINGQLFLYRVPSETSYDDAVPATLTITGSGGTSLGTKNICINDESGEGNPIMVFYPGQYLLLVYNTNDLELKEGFYIINSNSHDFFNVSKILLTS